MMGILSKRKRLSDADDNAASKRSNSNNQDTLVSSAAANTKTPQFQGFHLQLLRSLYDTDDGPPINRKDDDHDSLSVTHDSEIAEDTVDEQLWTKARKFVQEREYLMKLKKEASKINCVHQEALDYMKEKDAGTLLVTSTPIGKQTRASWPCWTTTTDDRPITSPNSLSFFSPPQRSTSITTTTAAPSRLELPLACGGSGGGTTTNCFGLVAAMLQNRSQRFNANVMQRSTPFAPLLRDVKEKIETLEGNLQKLKESTLSKQKQKVEDLLLSRALVSSSYNNSTDPTQEEEEEAMAAQQEMKDFISKVESKLQLWNMLDTDLKDVVGDISC